MKYCILNGKVILKDQVIDANVFVSGSKITEISKRQPEDETVIDAKGRYVSPGFIDVHSHGRGGSDTMYPTFDDINTITTASIKTGVTSILPTTMTMSVEDTYANLQSLVASSSLPVVLNIYEDVALFTSAVCIRSNDCAACQGGVKRYELKKDGRTFEAVSHDCQVQVFDSKPYVREPIAEMAAYISLSQAFMTI